MIMAMAFALVFRERSPAFILLAILSGLLFGSLLNFFTYVPFVKRRIRKYIKKSNQGCIPARTIYTIGDGQITCTCMDVSISFNLAHLEEVSDSDGRLELNFGQRGLCTIPLRVFDSAESKVAFVGKIHSEQGAAANP